MTKSQSEKSPLGGTGYQPVASGDSPDGLGRVSNAKASLLVVPAATVVPVAGSPTGAGGSPAPPIFQTGSKPTGDLCVQEKPTRLAPLLGGKEAASRPLSFAQERLWFLAQFDPSNPAYNIPCATRIRGVLDVVVLEKALTEILRRHEVLRTRFPSLEGQPTPVVCAPREVNLEIEDLQGAPESEKAIRVQQRWSAEFRHVFDLSAGPLWRLSLLRLGPEEHVLLWNVHHIVYDAWSHYVWLRELATLYSAFVKREPSPLRELPIQYADFARGQRECMEGDLLQRRLKFWMERLKGELPVLQLPFDHPRPMRKNYAGTMEVFPIPSALGDALKQLSRREGVSLYMLLLTAFATFLRRYSSQEDLVIGSPVTNRSRVEIESLIGLFLNMLPLRIDASGEPSFRELLRRVRDITFGALENQDLPFERLVEELRPERSLNQDPFFQVVFDFQPRGDEKFMSAGVEFEPMEVKTNTAKFDLSFFVRDTAQGLKCLIEYNTDLFEAATIRRMAGHFEVLLRGIVANSNERISRLPLLPEAERRQILCDWNNTQSNYPREASIVELFETQVEKSPEALAVAYGETRFSYRELNARANRLANHLRALGVGSEAMVGVCVERSPEMIVAWLGILKAGGAYVPLDPSYPKERLAFMVEDAAMPVVLTRRALLPVLPECRAQFIYLEDSLANCSEENLRLQSRAESLAYVMYTSGSTGRPKGVLVVHRGVVRLVRNTNYIQFEASDRLAQISNASFDAATFEVWGALLNGGALIGITREVALSPKEFAAELAAERMTSLFLTVTLFNQLAREAPGCFQTVKNLIFGGEAAEPKWVRQVLRDGPPQRLLNGYGPTETTTFALCELVNELSADATNVPIGRPIANSQAYVLDAHLQPVPIGVTGEIYLGGDGLGRGYLNQPELTAQKFVPHPFHPGQRLYRTGDLGRFRSDGKIEFLGRMDHQVKLRGFRIELGEIEAALGSHPAVKECVMIARKASEAYGLQLVAYVVFHEGHKTTTGQLRQFLKEKLPEYMVPAAFLTLEALPVTPNGKLNRDALPEPNAKAAAGENLAPPTTPAEQTLGQIWCELLKIESVGIHDNFFELGGHSLLATQLAARIGRKFEISLPLRTLFEAPTIGQLARVLEAKQLSGEADMPPLRRRPSNRAKELLSP